jgi:hypothetical protein
MHKLSLNTLLFLSLWLVCVSLQDQYQKSTGVIQGQQTHKEALFKGMSLRGFCMLLYRQGAAT